MRANERENERELQLIRAALQIFFFFFLCAEPCPRPLVRKKIFCASRLVPAPKVHRESRDKFWFCASRLVYAPKGHRESGEKHFFCTTRLVPAPKVGSQESR